MGNFNIEIFSLINRYAGQNSFFDSVAIVFAKYAIFIVPAYLIWLFLKKDDYFKQQSLFAFWSGLVGLALNFLITLVYFNPRPFMVHIGHALISHPPDSSFPSDHTTLMLSLGFYLLFQSKLSMHGIVFIIAGFFVGLARVFCGIHWPIDIAGSFVVAIISALFIVLIRNYLYGVNRSIILISNKIIKNLGVK